MFDQILKGAPMNHIHFTIDERESIFKFLAIDFKKIEIARKIGRNKSNVGREILRNFITRE